MDYQIIDYLANQRGKQLGDPIQNRSYKDIVVNPGETKTIEGGGDSYYINEADTYMTIKSDNGSYDSNSPILNENEEVHNGTIVLTNNITIVQRVKFVIISYMADTKNR